MKAKGALLGPLALGFAIAGALMLYAASAPWRRVTVTREPPLPEVTQVLSGGTLVPMLTACGALSLAAVVGLLATGLWGRRLVAVAVGLTSIVTGYLTFEALSLSSAELMRIAQDMPAIDQADLQQVSQFAVVAGIAGVALAIVSSVLLLIGASRIPTMGAKYERATTSAKPTSADATAAREGEELQRWRALDRGEDPT